MSAHRGSFREAARLAREKADALDSQYQEQRKAQLLESALYNLTQAKALRQFADELEGMASD